eukprot:TRINITY_DN1191_c0_g1_i10.p1 TRINITY_DN1191_c0_g1~~TRINITY_DN1191_c0_g1_i10.p1  ORF type:complete len:202 (+),score=-15.51 TRINITY_DN1191_c0_g1_i10:695-1300(+)
MNIKKIKNLNKKIANIKSHNTQIVFRLDSVTIKIFVQIQFNLQIIVNQKNILVSILTKRPIKNSRNIIFSYNRNKQQQSQRGVQWVPSPPQKMGSECFSLSITKENNQTGLPNAQYKYSQYDYNTGTMYSTTMRITNTTKVLIRYNIWNKYQCILCRNSNEGIKNTLNTSIIQVFFCKQYQYLVTLVFRGKKLSEIFVMKY